jgi:hypothetical protein
MKAFPDPSSSPVHYTRSLSSYGFETIASAGTHAWAWVRAFRHVVHLQTVAARWNDSRVSLAPLYGLFPSLRSISIHNSRIPPSELLDLICSFPPPPRDLQLQNVSTSDSTANDEWSAPPSTLPELTGTLRLNGWIGPVIWRSLNLLNDRSCFVNIVMTGRGGDADLMADLVSKCSETLESLSIGYLSVVCFLWFLWLANILLLPTGPVTYRDPSPFDLFKAMKLKDVECHLYTPDVQWITKTL